MRRLRSDPTVAGKLWQTILEARPDARSKEAIVDVGVPFVSRLIAFQEAINQSLPNSGSASSFEETWAVQEEVEQEVHRWRQEIGQVLVESMPSFPQANSPGKIDESERALDQFIAFANEYERAILLLVGTMSASRADPLLEQLLAMESSLAAILRARASNVQTNAKAYERELTSDESLPVEPVEQQASDRTTEGRCERWLVELDDVTARLFSLGH